MLSTTGIKKIFSHPFLNPTKIIPMDKITDNLNSIAAKKHFDDRLTMQYPFLQLSPDSINTYSLGFMRGIAHAASIWNKEFPADECPTIFTHENLNQ